MFQRLSAPLQPTEWNQLTSPLLLVIFALAFLGAFLTVSLHVMNGRARIRIPIIGISLLYLVPFLIGKTGMGIIDFGVPAFSMLGTLNIADCFYLRSVDEVKSWSYATTFCHIMAYPKETPSESPRWNNLKAIFICALKYLAVNILLYFTPNSEQWNQIPTFSFSYFFHSMAVGFSVLFTLASLIEITIRLIGLILGVEQSPLFNNPNGATNVRIFWSRWNLAIKTGLGRWNVKIAQNPISNGLRSRSTAKIDTKTTPSIIKSRFTAFWPKAIGAFITFIISGLFHEAMNKFAFTQPFGESLAFFALNGLATVFYSYLARYHPSTLERIPSWFGCLITNGLLIILSPLFVAPFIRANFFDQFKELGIFGPVDSFFLVFGGGF